MIKYFISLILLIFVCSGCTENARARAFGGTITITLPKGKEFVNATWKNCNVWYVVKDRPSGKEPQVYEFIEKSNQGILEGKVVFVEQ